MKVTTPFFLVLLFSLAAAHDKKAARVEPEAGSFLQCAACQLLVSTLAGAIETDPSLEKVEQIATKVCQNLGQDRVTPICSMIVNTMAPTLLPILVKVGVNPTRICAALEYCPQVSNSTIAYLEKVKMQNKHAEMHDRKNINLKKDVIDTPAGTILHLSDIHWDDLYENGTIVDCNIPLCCRSNSVLRKGGDPNKKAGKWGDITCDMPENMLHALLESAATTKPNAIIITGDNTPHDIWNQTKELTMKRLERVTDALNKYFPNTPIIMALGNHDSYPVDQFNRIGPDVNHLDNFDWLLTAITKYWTPWLTKFTDKTDSARALNDLRNFGHYSISPVLGLRVVALNTMWADFFNWYNLLDEGQGQKQFEWLETTLRVAKNSGEKVILAGHIPPYDSNFDESGGYIPTYHSIFHKYKDIIVAQLYGHTHTDQYNLMFTNGLNETATGMIYQTSSTGAFGHQPAYRSISYDSKFNFLDYDHYITNIEDANKNDKPVWKKEYSAKAEYGLKDLSVASWDDLWHRFSTDDALFQKWYRNSNTQTNTAVCDANCKKGALCRIGAIVGELC